ncbi:hypothetical protein BpHYR1_002346 [Brachionus plicatilis]|uniref:Uncharacterized protein n=1 Tax=Brachionus plicatilis TaxID=10195 RepID=A0A3M7Q0S3_BRAPC|nr:hypothetical protein BpHYR1_002346 [Brachionus plicatilis]
MKLSVSFFSDKLNDYLNVKLFFCLLFRLKYFAFFYKFLLAKKHLNNCLNAIILHFFYEFLLAKKHLNNCLNLKIREKFFH